MIEPRYAWEIKATNTSDMKLETYMFDYDYVFALRGPDQPDDAGVYDIYFLSWMPKEMLGIGIPDQVTMADVY